MTDIQKLLKLEQMLNEQNILTKFGHLCCCSCASSDLYNNMSDTDIGIAWSHSQDIEALLNEGDMYIGYDADKETDRLKIANTIFDIAAKLGLNPIWNADTNIRINVYANIDEDEAVEYLNYEVDEEFWDEEEEFWDEEFWDEEL